MYTTLVLSVENSDNLEILESEIISFMGSKNLIDNSLNVFLFKEKLSNLDKQRLLGKVKNLNCDIMFIEHNNFEIFEDINTVKL